MSDEYVRFAERFVLAFESIAQSLAGLNEAAGKAGSRFWPQAHQPREAVVSRVPTEEDIIREAQGGNQPIADWLKIPGEDEEFIGEREKAFLEDQKRNESPEAEVEGQDSGSSESSGSDAAASSGGTGDNTSI